MPAPGARSPRHLSWARSLGFALLFTAAVMLGRTTVMDGTSLSLVWPAAGVAVVWFLAQRRAGTGWFDWSALSAITFVINQATGATAALAACFVVANVVQVAVFTAVFSRWCPGVWGAGGSEPLQGVRQLWRLLGAAAVATGAGALFGPTAVGVLTGHWSWLAFAVWMTRNSASIMLITLVGVRLGAAAHRRRTGAPRLPGPRPAAAEVAAVMVVSAIAYVLTFGYADGLPLSFLLIIITVWVGSRFDTTFTAVHDLVVSTLAVLLTLQGWGLFASIESDAVRALVVQAFILVTAVTALSLALLRDERDALLATVSRQAQEAAAQASLLSTVVESMQEGVIAVDATGAVVLRNAAATTLLGGVRSDTGQVREAGHYGLSTIDGDPLAPEDMPHTRAMRGQRVVGERVRVSNDGVPLVRVLEITAVPLPAGADDAGAPPCSRAGSGAVVVYHDATATHERESDMAQFATVVAHDLRGPLAGLRGWLELATDHAGEEPGDADGEQHRRTSLLAVLARVERSAAQLDQLIADLLDHAVMRRATLRAEPLDLGALVRRVLDVYAAPDGTGRGLLATTDVPADLPRVRADPVLVQQLLANLVGNAVKYVREGERPQVHVCAHAGDGALHVVVADRGIGVPAGQHERIFDDLHRAHPGYTGSGLGLGLCRRIVERHGGTIAAGDNPGGGTRVDVTLPISSWPGTAGQQLADTATAPAHQGLPGREVGVQVRA